MRQARTPSDVVGLSRALAIRLRLRKRERAFDLVIRCLSAQLQPAYFAVRVECHATPPARGKTFAGHGWCRTPGF